MAWTAPITVVTNDTLTAAQWNQQIRDNFNQTEVAKATFPTSYFVSTGTNAIAQRAARSAFDWTSETTTSTTYTDLKHLGPSVTLTTGVEALVFFSCAMSNSGANALAACSVAVSGATTVASSDSWRLSTDGCSAGSASDNNLKRGMFHHFTALTAGSNTFTMQYKVGSGTGFYASRELAVLPF